MKLFTDAVHKQIAIPRRYCSQIIDTEIFQRLKRVEQTYVSAIFPTATHNRFVHSIGVYHVGKYLFNAIEDYDKNQTDTIRGIVNKGGSEYIASLNGKESYEVLKESFLVACLLHDCGHAPFSHTFEEFYTCYTDSGKTITEAIVQAKEIIIKGVLNKDGKEKSRCERFIEDFRGRAKANLKSIKPHEYVSSWLVLQEKGFYKAITTGEVYADPLLVVRMIMGVPFNEEGEQEKAICEILNCYIGLLNGHLIDADRIDYAARDQWATGVSSTNFNLIRLLSSIHIAQNNNKKYVIAYNKRALTELQSLVEVKNFSNYWVFNHHKFKILEDDLKKSVVYLAVLLNDKQEEYDKILKKIEALKQKGNCDSTLAQKREEKNSIENNSLVHLFDYHTLIDKKECIFRFAGQKCKEIILYPSDDDIRYLLKRYFSDFNKKSKLIQMGNTAYKSWFSRSGCYIPVWKSYLEYEVIFRKPIKTKLEKMSLDGQQRKSVNLLLEDSGSIGHDFYRYLLGLITSKLVASFSGSLCKNPFRELTVEQTVIQGMEKLGASVFVQIAGDFIEYNKLKIPYKSLSATYEPYFYLFVHESFMRNQGASPTSENIRRMFTGEIDKLTEQDILSVIGKYIK